MEERNIENDEMDEVMLPGFKFHPTDEELVGFYLRRKVQQKPLSVELIKQIDIYKYDPWDLPKLATTGEKDWYFYCPRDRKYRNSARPNRVTGAGFWKATGTDRPIYSSDGSKCIGLKKSLVFYKGKAARGIKTDWMMHEFRLPFVSDSVNPKKFLDKIIPANEAWAICRIFKKPTSSTKRAISQSWILPGVMFDIPVSEMMMNLAPVNSGHQFGSSNISMASILHFDFGNGVEQQSSSMASFNPLGFSQRKSAMYHQMGTAKQARQVLSEAARNCGSSNASSSLLQDVSNDIFNDYVKGVDFTMFHEQFNGFISYTGIDQSVQGGLSQGELQAMLVRDKSVVQCEEPVVFSYTNILSLPET